MDGLSLYESEIPYNQFLIIENFDLMAYMKFAFRQSLLFDHQVQSRGRRGSVLLQK